ncbi:hypothetical protein BATDEDRAFT_86689 [Batrachochytrium dendrobatidis JAM81]|uniref:Uncharacterized protein n=3 Tax=Batrachochytrium dendrobatidis TaxID=109871 RepID=F4NWQ9_BATDJ|nr:uncharacterized protein BATDEDRAFT_86689 [Batrachochytrium dendrobatidis JAM81]EGF82528.1 hypothetical protein BATDEDRAFT_86689 [Batrachochytrium dendrobatidis JAM81]OAJ39444.1 hypothetical protein BDEG_23291 [Batrachochytrium dendrobatidis JEL423]|eukprot:XP_006676957.1 hypothetical protein BATDEDRAFT_86689 [Batrachochytrium dendrobatidis JAM81]
MSLDMGSTPYADTELKEQSTEHQKISELSQNIAISAIAEQFLDVPEVSLEMRAYLVQTTLPTVVLSLEKLIIEVERRKNLECDGIDKSLKNECSRSIELADSQTTLDDATNMQYDLPKDRFDALNWLAQHLFRNNPTYSNFSEETSSPYVKSIKAVAEGLYKKISDLVAFKEAKKIADELAKQDEIERIKLAQIARIDENRRIFTSLLGSTFKIWTTSIWRKQPGVLYRSEIIEEFKSVAQTTDIQSCPELYAKVIEQCEYISKEKSSMNIDIPPNNLLFDPSEPIYALDPAAVERWDCNFFTKMNLKLMCMWSVNELTNFLRVLSSKVSGHSTLLNTVYKEHLYVPKFKLSPNSTVNDWLEALLPISEVLKLDDSIHEDAASKAFKDFCLGKSNPRFQNETDTDITADSDDTVAVSESIYKGFAKGILGEFGTDLFCSLMTQIKKEVEEEQIHAEKRTARANAAITASQISSAVKAQLETKNQALDQIGSFLACLLEPSGVLRVGYLIKILTIIIDNPDISPTVLKLLSSIRSHLGSLETVSIKEMLIKIESICESDIQGLAEMVPLLTWALDVVTSKAAESKENTFSRSKIEQEALEEIETMALQTDLSVSTACNAFINVLENAFQKIHPNSKAFGRVSLVETALTGLTNGHDKLTDEDLIASSGVIESFMRTVATSKELRSTHLGLTTNEGSGIDYHIILLENNVLIEDVASNAMLSEDSFVTAVTKNIQSNEQAKFMGVSLVSAQDKPFGAFDMVMCGPEILTRADMDFSKLAVSRLVSLLTRIENRIKSIEVAKSAMSYLSSRCSAEIQIFIVEPNPKSLDPEIFQIESVSLSTPEASYPQSESRSIQASPYIRPWSSRLSKVEKDDIPGLSEKLVEVCTTGLAITVPENQIGYCVIPINNANGECIALVTLKSDSNMEALDERVKEISKLCKLIAGALENFKESQFGAVESTQSVHLDASSIDEMTRRRFIFGKIVLGYVRELLLKMDNRALAELRSYKKPPKSVHRLVKGVLYIFGKTPKEVKIWLDTVKLFTMEIVKKMIHYDPTAIQKKIRFTRVKRILKMVPFQDQGADKNYVGSPAQIIRDWLTVVVELRDQAVTARRARPDVFALASPESTIMEDADEEEEDVEKTASDGNIYEADTKIASHSELNSQPNDIADNMVGEDTEGSQLDLTVRFGDEDVVATTDAPKI